MANPKDLPRDVGGFIRDLRRNAKISLRQLADQAGVSNPYLSQVERGLRKPSAEVLQQLASALRVSTPVMYLRAGLLDDKEGHGVLASIAADADLTMPQKQSLSQIYETFRRENARQAETAAPTEAAAPTTAPTETTAPAEATAPTEAAAPTTAPTPGDGGSEAVDDVLESVARTETGTAPAPNASQPAKRTARKAARKTAPAVEEE
ncbi:helix-turn-helix domain-containing protein [Micromonospora sp. NBC_01796]|uniref:helix-turn-helix domain-containing protein n=1 Tax=Micromonospora sp. NBC_01796 TaxID=2975987 RepID=UPI002DDBA43F|nr:helix-turn-helix transcriptional regulator [Micromonospora sp. NBC_01796]WSA89046.1 helix-turn-helix domain-containing protein [Micromonospora sp. NBC_01796]